MCLWGSKRSIKNLLTSPRLLKLFPVFSSANLIFLSFTYRSTINLEICVMWDFGSQYNFWHNFIAPLKFPFLQHNRMLSFSYIRWLYMHGIVSVPLVYFLCPCYSILSLLFHEWYQYIKSSISSISFCFQDCFTYSWSFGFPYKF